MVTPVSISEALAAWEENGPTSLTVALMGDALYAARARAERTVEEVRLLGEQLVREGDEATERRSYTQGSVLRNAGYRVFSLAVALECGEDTKERTKGSE